VGRVSAGSKKWNWPLWIGFLCVLTGFFSYPFLIRFPAIRNFPWPTYSLFCVGGLFLLVGLFRAFGNPKLYRGKVFGPIFAVLSLLATGFFCYGMFYEARELPPSTEAPRVGQKAPEFTLSDQNGKMVSLAELLAPALPGAAANGALLIFYRGFW
jgi:hypothetical protein